MAKREDNVEKQQEAVLQQAKDEKKAWVKACTKTKHPEGTRLRGKDVGGVHKSGGTCRNEWAELNK